MTALNDDPVRARAIELGRGDEDREILIEAAELVIRSGLGSWKMLQRKMRLPQGHAQRVLSALEAAGIVDPEVADHRRVRVDPGDLKATLVRLADWSPAAGEDTPAALAEAPEEPPAAPPATSAGGSDVSLVKPPAPAPAGDHQPDRQPPATSHQPAGTSLEKRRHQPPAERPTSPPAVTTSQEPEPPADPQPPLLVGRLVNAHQRVVTVVRTDNRVTRSVRRAARYQYVAGQGVWSWLHRATKASNHGNAREQLAMARLSADPKAVADWLAIVDGLRNNRIKRLQRLPQALAAVGITSLAAVLAVLVMALVVGVLALVAWGSAGWSWWWWLAGWAGLVFAGLVVAGAALTVVLAVPVTISKAHREGMRMADPPRWLLSLDERITLDAEITPTRVALALGNCGIPALRVHIKESPDRGAELLSSIATDGKGIGVLVRLIPGVSTEDVLKRRKRIAEACDRHEHELLMSIPKPGHIYMWFANPGVMEESIGESPLVTATGPIKANIEKGRAPWGETVKGEPVGVNLYQQHLLITGLSNQGKTRCLRALALWAAFDTHAHFWIANLKGVDGDFDMFRDICDPGRFIKGPSDLDAVDATHMVEDAEQEMIRRLESGRTDWPTLFVIVDEAQRAYTNPLKDEHEVPYGGQANNSRYCKAVRNIKNQGRAVNVVIWEGTQDPTNQNLPKLTREASHIRISLVVGTESQARMALGDAAVDGGAAPNQLRKDIDRGTVVMHGGGVPIPLGESSLTVRTYHIDDAQAWTVAGRALAKRRSRAGGGMVIDAAPEKVDHLMNFHQAMGGRDKVRTVEILGQLMEDWPDIYDTWGAQEMSKVIDAYAAAGHDIDVRKREVNGKSGQRVLVLEEVETVLRARDEILP